jgi:hypothetical protein
MKSLLIVLFCSFPISAQAQPSYILTTADSGVSQMAPRVEHKANETYIAYIRANSGASGDIMFTSRSIDAEFIAPVAVTNSGKVNASLQRGPEFVVAPNGSIHMVWMEQRIDNNPDIFYARSTDNGVTWTSARDISLDGQRATQDFPSIAVDSLGGLYVIFIDNRDVVDDISTNDHISITRSFDDGTTWTAPVRVEKNPGDVGGSCECCRTAIAASPDGHVYVVYRSNMKNYRDIFVARSMNRGESFEESIRVQTTPWMIMACPATGPMVTLDARENLHVVYRSSAINNKSAIFYNLLPNGSDKTFKEQSLSPAGGSSANFADIAVTPKGALSVVYQQSGLIYERVSTDGGNFWRAATKVDSLDAMQSFAIVSYDAQQKALLTSWQDDRRDPSDIIYKETPFDQYVVLPELIWVNATEIGDSVLFKWAVVGSHQAIWYRVSMFDTSFVTFSDSVMLPRSFLQHSAFTISPHSAIGDGLPEGVQQLLVLSSSKRESLSNRLVSPGEHITLSVTSPRDLVWTAYDIQGRNVGSASSVSRGEEQILEIPSLHPGVYHLRCEELALDLKLVVVDH